MNANQRAEELFSRARKLGLANPITGEAAPTLPMVQHAMIECEADTAPEADDLATFVRRLVRIVRKTDPHNAVAASAVEFLKCTGRSKIFTR